MDEQQKKQLLKEFINTHPLMVLSTVDESGAAHAAPVFVVGDDNFNFWFITPVETKKYLNILKNPEVVLTAVDEDQVTTLHMRAKATSSDNLSDVLALLAQRLGESKARLVTTLPLLRYSDQEKTAVELKVEEMGLRIFKDDDIVEHNIALG